MPPGRDQPIFQDGCVRPHGALHNGKSSAAAPLKRHLYLAEQPRLRKVIDHNVMCRDDRGSPDPEDIDDTTRALLAQRDIDPRPERYTTTTE